MANANSGTDAADAAAAAGAPEQAAPIFLRAEDVRRAARKALVRGDLPAAAFYSAPCAIGCALTPEQFARLTVRTLDDLPIKDLINAGVVETDDAYFLIKLQEANDTYDEEWMRKILGVRKGAA